MPDLALLAGIPSVGKSRLVRYATEQGALAINMEAPPVAQDSLDSANLRAAGNTATTGNLVPFLEALRARTEPQVLLEWGFPPQCLPLVERLHQAGIFTWWLDGDAEQARIQHQRASKDLNEFDRQIAAIRTSRIELDTFFEGRKILQLRPDGTFVADEDVFRAIFPIQVSGQSPGFSGQQNPS